MRGNWKKIDSLFIAAVFAGLLGASACATRGTVRVYDPVYRDYHNWNHDEDGYYRQWERDNHQRDEDFNRRSQQEQDEYWRWRHQHENDQH